MTLLPKRSCQIPPWREPQTIRAIVSASGHSHGGRSPTGPGPAGRPDPIPHTMLRPFAGWAGDAMSRVDSHTNEWTSLLLSAGGSDDEEQDKKDER